MRRHSAGETIGALAATLVVCAAPAMGRIIDIRAVVTSEVRQTENGSETQSDFAQESVPSGAGGLPVTALAKLDGRTTDGLVTGGAGVFSVFNPASLTGLGIPSDVGLDIGVFSGDPTAAWFAQGGVTETRSVVLSAAELGPAFAEGTPARVRSRVVLAGILMLTAFDPLDDLTGVEVNMQFSVTQHGTSAGSTVLISGEAMLRGGPNGTVEVVRTGELSNMLLPIIDLPGPITDLPFEKAVIFPGLTFPYEYDVVAGEPFELELLFGADIRTSPGGIAATAVFGLPPVELPTVFAGAQRGDLGTRVAAAITDRVDPTGVAYVSTAPEPAVEPVPDRNSLCGVLGMESFGAALWIGMLACHGVTRRRVCNGRTTKAAAEKSR